LSVPPRVTTSTIPVVAPDGTLVVISDGEPTLNAAEAPLKVTLGVPVRRSPRIWIAAPALPEVGKVSTDGFKPTLGLKTVP
jgi:hypothetical protein